MDKVTDGQASDRDDPQELSALRASVGDLRAQLERARQDTHQFVAMLAHELRAPLGAVLMWVHVLRMGRDSDREAALDAIDSSARAQSELIGRLLDVTRGLAGRLRVQGLPLDLAETVSAAVASRDLQEAATGAGAKLTLSVEHQPLPVTGDRGRLTDMVAALVKNALRATPVGGRVDILVARWESMARMTVSDQGPGLTPEEVASVFTPFRLAGELEPRRPGDLGLDLPLARMLAELHRGRASARSAGHGQGTTITIDIPLTPAVTATATATAPLPE